MNPTQMFRNSDSNTKSIPIQPILRHIGLSSDALFPMLLQSHPQPTESTVVIEVGCFRLQQSLLAAKNGFRTYSVEASPTNYKQMTTRHDQLLTEDKKAHDLITILNKAGSAKSRQVLTFDAIGGTGDHVAGVNLDAAQKTKYDVNPASKVQVETLALDDLIDSLPSGSHVFLAKIDVQGHEASVFEGMQKSISQGKIRYILFEYWVDALDQAAGLPTGSCSSVNTILRPLYNAGYSLYDLSVLFHPGANDKSTQMANWKKWFRPVDAQEHCEWFANLGKRGREELNYEMGYWTDILAVYGGAFSLEEQGNPLEGGRDARFK